MFVDISASFHKDSIVSNDGIQKAEPPYDNVTDKEGWPRSIKPTVIKRLAHVGKFPSVIIMSGNHNTDNADKEEGKGDSTKTKEWSRYPTKPNKIDDNLVL